MNELTSVKSEAPLFTEYVSQFSSALKDSDITPELDALVLEAFHHYAIESSQVESIAF